MMAGWRGGGQQIATAARGWCVSFGRLVAFGSQLVVATHSPVVASTPGASILEVGEWGLRPTTWDELELVGSWRRFLADPERYLRYLLAEEG
jgi:predicted ATPase